MTVVPLWTEDSACHPLHIREIQNEFKRAEAKIRQIQLKNEVRPQKKNLSNEPSPSSLAPSLAVFKPKPARLFGECASTKHHLLRLSSCSAREELSETSYLPKGERCGRRGDPAARRRLKLPSPSLGSGVGVAACPAFSCGCLGWERAAGSGAGELLSLRAPPLTPTAYVQGIRSAVSAHNDNCAHLLRGYCSFRKIPTIDRTLFF